MRLRLWQLIVLVFVSALMISAASGVVTGLLIKDGINSSNKKQAARLFTAQVSGCYRQNIRTVAQNRNANATFKGDKSQIAENLLFASAVATPRPGATVKERQLTLAFHTRLESSIGTLADEIATLTWTPVVRHCAKAPTTIELPVAFGDRKPPIADLALTPATRGPQMPVPPPVRR